MAKGFRRVRIFILLLVLLFVATESWLTRVRATAWDQPLWVVIYPINGDGSRVSQDYIARLEEDSFMDIEQFIDAQRLRFGIDLDEPVDINLAGALSERPPLPPHHGSKLDVMLWSLKMRYWAWQQHRSGPRPDIQIFVQYYDPAQYQTLPHSLGVQKGMYGVVHAFAHDRLALSNQVVITHELLHTLGATDKYDMATNQPFYPLGYAYPHQQPVYPQTRGEIMAGRIPLSPSAAREPKGLYEMMVGEQTAMEINWQ